jgi:hypothetical protein
MSVGSPMVAVRFNPKLLTLMMARIEEANRNRQGAPWTRSDFILTAVREKLSKMERSRKAGGRRNKREAAS